MDIILLLGCFCVTILAGWSLLGLILRREKGADLLERLSLSFGIGMGAIAVEMLVFYFLTCGLP